MSKSLLLTAVAVVLAVAIARAQGSPAANESLWEAARAGDTARITAALAQGADVNAKSRYEVTPLIFAAGNGRLDAVKLLVSRGASVNALDTFYRASAVDMGLGQGHIDVVVFLLQNGADADDVLSGGVQTNNDVLVRAALAGKVSRQGLQSALGLAEKTKRDAFGALIKAALDRLPADAAANVTAPAAPAAAAPVAAPTSPPTTLPARPPIVRPTGPRNWPGFRGEASAGNGDGQRAVAEWDVVTGRNIRWKTPIPGVATSSPIVWGNRVFATTAISKAGDSTFRTGLYGDVKPVEDLSAHEWKIYSLDKVTGRIVWERTAFAGVPVTKRHTKSSQAGSTPVTDGRRVVAVFGSASLLAAWDFDGKELWRVDLGALDSGWFYDPAFQWGHSSSPIIYRNSVILQADVQKDSYIGAWDLDTGKPLWKTQRADEISTWGTPTIARTAAGPDGQDVLITNGTKVRGYDPSSGTLMWTLGPNSEITIGTPVVSNGLVFVTGGYPPVRPIYAIRPGVQGDISLPKGQTSSPAIAWSNMTDGTYIPTPIVYDGYLFTLNINGIVNAYNPENGQRAFRGRVGTGGSFSASPVGADGRLYIASEDGEVYVLTAAEGLTQVARNEMKEVIMATPAISDGLIVVRTLGHLYGIGQ